ncbi:MAG: GntG family PLP-dependent aldolase [Fimbriimonadaceae bacterium]|nr:GntG family PLP-dependent aldolase [Fimbriimonadaceae bacterium]
MRVDLRSDTVTQPTAAMREAMANAPVGDDVLGDDPTVAELESTVAELTGKAAALFVPSGTMGNQIALACHADRGSALIAEEEAHLLYYEVGASALLAGLVSWTLASDRGFPEPDAIRRRVLREDLHRPGTAVIALENSHNRKGGTVMSDDELAAYAALRNELGIPFHLDGARAWNAAVALQVPIAHLLRGFDSASLCLSKGLGSPVGSVLVGPAEFIARARRWRKRLGGGMRQAGILAACGLISVRDMVDRLAEDHARAARLAQEIRAIGPYCPDAPETNIVLVHTIGPAAEVVERLATHDVHCFPVAERTIRLVTHYGISDDAVDATVAAFTRAA